MFNFKKKNKVVLEIISSNKKLLILNPHILYIELSAVEQTNNDNDKISFTEFLKSVFTFKFKSVCCKNNPLCMVINLSQGLRTYSWEIRIAQYSSNGKVVFPDAEGMKCNPVNRNLILTIIPGPIDLADGWLIHWNIMKVISAHDDGDPQWGFLTPNVCLDIDMKGNVLTSPREFRNT